MQCSKRRIEEKQGDKMLKRHFIAKVVVGHRVTIPKEVCQVLAIKDGDLIDVDIEVAEIPYESENNCRSGE
jgi:bifunctional DNA-binding transcriptional regulator/antitoxin component of YhaV-PrlF toxin-antitoxin module